MSAALPTGVVTFLLSDVEDSSGHWTRAGAAPAMARQRAIIAGAVAAHGGVQPVEQGEGDSTVSVFSRPSAALTAAIAIQRALLAEPWPGEPVRVRLGVHTGEAVLVDERTYGGQSIIRGARLRDLACGGQVLVSAATALLAQDDLPDDASLRALAVVQLKGLTQPEQPHQLEHPDLPRGLPVPLPAGPGSGLPRFATSFIGRSAEIAQLGELIEGARLVTITGAGGSGKTRLAHQVALASVDAFEDGVVWVDLAGVDDGDRVASVALEACGLRESPGGADAGSMLVSHLGSCRRLVVLDNCEHVLGGVADVVGDFLGHESGSVIVATSREPLGVGGETVWRIPSLEVPREGAELEEAWGASAVGLFCERARAGRPEFVLDPDTVGAVAAICRRLDGIPLAIELAAARLRAMSLDDLLAGLADRFRLLAAGPRGLERHRTLLASLDWSHDLLDADEQALLRRLGVFTSPFSIAAAEAVAADDALDALDVFDVLARLIDKSLVLHDERGYRMLETIRQYALGKAIDAGEMGALRRRHLAWFAERAERWGFDREPAREDVFLEAEAVLSDLRAALEWALHEDAAAVLRLVAPLGDVIGLRMRYRELTDLARTICRDEAEGSPVWLERLGALVRWLPLTVDPWWMGPARAALDAGAVPPVVAGRLEFALCFIDLFSGTPGVADRVAAIGAVARADHDEILVATTASNLAMATATAGDLRRAVPVIAWSERHLADHPGHTAAAHASRMLVAMWRGEPGHAPETLSQRSRSSVRPPIADVADTFVLAFTGDVDALRALAAEVERRELSGFAERIPAYVRGFVALETGDLDAAVCHFDRVVDLSITAADRALGRSLSALVGLALGALDAAATRAEDAVDGCRDRDAPAVEALAMLSAASVDHALGETSRALDRGHEALRLAEAHGVRFITVQLLELFAVIAADADKPELAGRLLGSCDAFRARGGLRFRWPHARGRLDQLRDVLDATNVAEGAELSIEQAVALVSGSRGERRRPPFGWDALTPAELRVVDLAAAGLSNRQIAEKLFVSVATVKTHLVHVYQKLELESRPALVAAAGARDRADA